MGENIKPNRKKTGFNLDSEKQNLETPTRLSLKSTLPSTNSFKIPKSAKSKFKRPPDE